MRFGLGIVHYPKAVRFHLSKLYTGASRLSEVREKNFRTSLAWAIEVWKVGCIK